MKPLRLGQVVLRAAVVLFAAWLYGGDLVRWSQAHSAEVSALVELPSLELGVVGTLVAVFGAGVLVAAQLQKRPAGWWPLRWLSLALLGLLFFDFVVLSSRQPLLSAEEQAQLAVHSVADTATELSSSQGVLRDPAALEAMVGELGAVPYFEKAARVPKWKVLIRERCAGPAADPGPSGAGTFVYCVSVDRQKAWVTLVGTAAGHHFGPRAIVSTEPSWVGEVHVAPPPPPEAPPRTEDPSVWDPPTPEDAP